MELILPKIQLVPYLSDSESEEEEAEEIIIPTIEELFERVWIHIQVRSSEPGPAPTNPRQELFSNSNDTINITSSSGSVRNLTTNDPKPRTPPSLIPLYSFDVAGVSGQVKCNEIAGNNRPAPSSEEKNDDDEPETKRPRNKYMQNPKDKMFYCPEETCKYFTPNPRSLATHMNRTHKIPDILCEICQQ